LWPVAAALLVMASGGVIWQDAARGPLADMEKLAAQELHGLNGLDIRSEDPAEIRTWLKATANIDIVLPASGGVRLLGARLIPRRGAPVAAVAYRVGDNDATLLVSRKPSVFSGKAASKHVFSRIESAGGARFFSWRTREQIYTIACSMTKDPQAGCLLCHANAPPLTTLN
jgi:anti-sigma factor RsiW